MMGKKNWPGFERDGVAIAVTASAQTFPLPDHAKNSNDVMIYNPGPLEISFRLGAVGMDPATLNSMVVQPGVMSPFLSRGSTHISCISTGNQTIKVWCGEGE